MTGEAIKVLVDGMCDTLVPNDEGEILVRTPSTDGYQLGRYVDVSAVHPNRPEWVAALGLDVWSAWAETIREKGLDWFDGTRWRPSQEMPDELIKATFPARKPRGHPVAVRVTPSVQVGYPFEDDVIAVWEAWMEHKIDMTHQSVFKS